MDHSNDRHKQREIRFARLHPNPEQAQSATRALDGIEGILELEAVSAQCLHVCYDVLFVTLEDIEVALTELGFHLDNSIIAKLKRALYYHTEETQRANLGCPRGMSNCTDKVFISRYERLHHGCRDGRPQHWRTYL